jgi:hypothetical protein
MSQFFVTRSLPQNELDFDIPVKLGVPEFTITTRLILKTFLKLLWL